MKIAILVGELFPEQAVAAITGSVSLLPLLQLQPVGRFDETVAIVQSLCDYAANDPIAATDLIIAQVVGAVRRYRHMDGGLDVEVHFLKACDAIVIAAIVATLTAMGNIRVVLKSHVRRSGTVDPFIHLSHVIERELR